QASLPPIITRESPGSPSGFTYFQPSVAAGPEGRLGSSRRWKARIAASSQASVGAGPAPISASSASDRAAYERTRSAPAASTSGSVVWRGVAPELFPRLLPGALGQAAGATAAVGDFEQLVELAVGQILLPPPILFTAIDSNAHLEVMGRHLSFSARPAPG